jgi:hypothetical protein
MRFALMLLLAAGCAKKPAADPDFDKRWSDAEKSVDPAVIESTISGQGLVGEVRRAMDSPSGLSPKKVDGPLPDEEITKVIRANLGQMKACYDAESGLAGSGKAIVTLDISQAGSVVNVKVDAPQTFNDTKVPACLGARAKNWLFPAFTAKAPRHFSYPLVFVGG